MCISSSEEDESWRAILEFVVSVILFWDVLFSHFLVSLGETVYRTGHGPYDVSRFLSFRFRLWIISNSLLFSKGTAQKQLSREQDC